MLQGFQERFIDRLRVLPGLLRQTLALLQRIIQFRIGRGHFLAGDHQLEHIGQRRIIGARLGQRDQHRRQPLDKRRLHEGLLDQLLVHLMRDHHQVPGGIKGEAGRLGPGPGLLKRQGEPVVPHPAPDQLMIRGLTPGRCQVHGAGFGTELEPAKHSLRHMRDHPLDQKLHALDIAIGLVDLQHGELGVVRPVEALVAEIAVQLEHLVKAADE